MLTTLLIMFIGAAIGAIAARRNIPDHTAELTRLSEEKTAFITEHTAKYNEILTNSIAAIQAETSIRTSEATRVIGAIIAGQIADHAYYGSPYSVEEVVTLVQAYADYAGYMGPDANAIRDAIVANTDPSMLRQEAAKGVSSVVAN